MKIVHGLLLLAAGASFAACGMEQINSFAQLEKYIGKVVIYQVSDDSYAAKKAFEMGKDAHGKPLYAGIVAQLEAYESHCGLLITHYLVRLLKKKPLASPKVYWLRKDELAGLNIAMRLADAQEYAKIKTLVENGGAYLVDQEIENKEVVEETFGITLPEKTARKTSNDSQMVCTNGASNHACKPIMCDEHEPKSGSITST